jgi:hypothetical protein
MNWVLICCEEAATEGHLMLNDMAWQVPPSQAIVYCAAFLGRLLESLGRTGALHAF